jgi:hypothetical protein
MILIPTLPVVYSLTRGLWQLVPDRRPTVQSTTAVVNEICHSRLGLRIQSYSVRGMVTMSSSFEFCGALGLSRAVEYHYPWYNSGVSRLMCLARPYYELNPWEQRLAGLMAIPDRLWRHPIIFVNSLRGVGRTPRLRLTRLSQLSMRYRSTYTDIPALLPHALTNGVL